MFMKVVLNIYYGWLLVHFLAFHAKPSNVCPNFKRIYFFVQYKQKKDKNIEILNTNYEVY